ncbi:hypothetical protein ABPG77_005745 [Micractinium sp. CCAP 211/92]
MASPAPQPPALSPSPTPEEALFAAEVVTSEEVITSVFVSLVTGFIFLALWVFFRKPLRGIYEKRVQLPDLRARPPPLRRSGLLQRCVGFLTPVFLLSDGELVQTAGLDALVLTRFLVLGVHIFVPVAALSCAVLIPLCMTGTVVDNAQYASTESIMRYTLSNIQPGSSKLWASFALSYVVLAWVGYCLYQHYKSFALFRLLHLHATHPAGGVPRMAVVGMEPRGWAAVRDVLLKLFSPLYMLHCDTAYAKQVLEQLNAAEAAAADAAGGSTDNAEAEPDEPLLGKYASGASGAESPLGKLTAEGKDFGSSAVLPWWLGPEQVPAEHSAARGRTGVIAGKTCPTLRKRVLATSAAGRPVWVSAESYAVLLTTAGPPPSRSLWALLRPTSWEPSGISVDTGGKAAAAGEAEQAGQGALQVHPALQHGSSSRMQLVVAGGELAGIGAEEAAAQLEQALKDLWPNSFAGLVRVYNHKAVDCLLVHHDEEATKRDRLVAAVAAARAQAKAQGCEGGADSKAGEPDAGRAAAEGGKKWWHCRAWRRTAAAAAARLAAAEARLAAQEQKVVQLEAEIEGARQAALKQPLGSAFIALFSDQTAAATAALVQASLVPALNFDVRPCPGPDDLNWAALWATWRHKLARRYAVMPFLVVVMIFPIGVLTGVLTNLSAAVCGGTPETNSLYWPWYCDQTSFGARLLKGLLQGILPSLISMLWDTYVLPMAFFFSAQSEVRHLALSDLDRRILVLFYCFNVSNTFLGSVLGGAVFQQIGSMVQEPGHWLAQLGTSLPTASTYFLNYIIIHTLSTNFFRFIWPHEGTVLFVIFRAFGLFRPKCERDHCMIRTAPSYRGARHFGSFALIFIMGLTYAVINPLVLPAAAGFFVTAWITWRYCALYFYERSYESGGRIFELLFTLMVWTMSLFSFFTSLVLASKKSYTAALIALFTQQIGLLLYHKKVTLSVGHYAKVLPLHSTLGAPRVSVDPATFLPPPLRKQAVGWYPEWGKVWEKYGISRYSL